MANVMLHGGPLDGQEYPNVTEEAEYLTADYETIGYLYRRSGSSRFDYVGDSVE